MGLCDIMVISLASPATTAVDSHSNLCLVCTYLVHIALISLLSMVIVCFLEQNNLVSGHELVTLR